MPKILLSIIAIIAVVVGLVACTSQPAPAQPKAEAPTPKAEVPAAKTEAPAAKPAAPAAKAATGPIKVGVLLALTGPDVAPNSWMEQGIRMTLDQAGWQVAGRKIELVVEDDAANPATGLAKAKKLVENDKVDVIIGPLFSHVAAAVIPYLAVSQIPNIALLNHAADVLKLGKGNVWMHYGSLAGSSAYTGIYAYDKMGYRTVSVLHEDYVAGEDTLAGFIKAFEKKGGKVVQVQRTPLNTMDYAPYLSNLQEADALVIWLVPANTLRFVPQYMAYGAKMPLLAAHSHTMPEPILMALGDKGVGMLSTSMYYTGNQSEANKKFLDAYSKKFKFAEQAPEYIVQAYTSTSILLEALKVTNGDTTPAVLNAALAKVKIDSPGGPISYTSGGMGVGDIYITQVAKEGSRYYWKLVDTYSQVVRDMPKELQ